MPMFRHVALPLLIGAVFLGPAVAAQSGEAQIVVTGKKVPPGFEPVTKTVSVGDLDLASEAGRKELNVRVERAVDEVCPMPMVNSPTYEKKDHDMCRTFAWDGARAQIDRLLQGSSAP